MQAEITREINEWLWQYGYPWAPSVLRIADLVLGLDSPYQPDGDLRPCPNSVRDLEDDDPVRIEMLSLAQDMMLPVYEDIGIEYLGRSPIVDGHQGLITQLMCRAARCGCPDFAPPKLPSQPGIYATGSGPWKNCHDVGDYHAAHIKFTNSPPSHLILSHPTGRSVFQEALKLTRDAYREIGLMLYFSGAGVSIEFQPPQTSIIQSNASFVSSSAGWIGLAIVGNNGMSCSSGPIWARFLQGFASSSSAEAKAHAWTLLIMHELAHNCGLGHTSGGVQNPSLNQSTRARWVGDVAESWMKGRFGGVAVPTKPDPPPPDPEPDDEKWWAWIVRKYWRTK